MDYKLINCFFIVVGINSTYYFSKPSNIYNLPQEAMEVADIIDSTEDFNGNIGVTFTLSTTQSFTKIEEVYYGLLSYSGTYNIYPVNSEGLTNKKYDVLLTETYYPADEIINSDYHLLAEKANSKIYKNDINVLRYQTISLIIVFNIPIKSRHFTG